MEPLRNCKMTCEKSNIGHYEETDFDSGGFCIVSEDEGVYTPRNAEESPLYQAVLKPSKPSLPTINVATVPFLFSWSAK